MTMENENTQTKRSTYPDNEGFKGGTPCWKTQTGPQESCNVNHIFYTHNNPKVTRIIARQIHKVSNA